MHLVRILPVLILALSCLAFTSAPDEFAQLSKTVGLARVTTPIDLVYKPVFQKQTMTTGSRTDTASSETAFAMSREVREAPGGKLTFEEKTESIASGERVVKADQPLIVMSGTMSPKGKVEGHDLALPGLESQGQGKGTPFGQAVARNMESLVETMILPEKPVGQGDVLLTVPAANYLGVGATQTAGPKEFSLRVEGRGVLDGREVLAATAREKLTFTTPQSPQAPFSMEIFIYRFYDLKTMAQLRAGSSTRITSQGRTFMGSMSLTTSEIR